MNNKRIPVTIITGFLGSGKTTLIRNLLRNSQQKLAVIVNEFGSIGLDGDLLKTCGICPDDEEEGRIIELNNGCLCCTVQEEFLPTMKLLLTNSDILDGIIIETSGLAFPLPLIKALSWPEIRSAVFINAVVSIVDGYALSKGSPVGDVDLFNQQRIKDESIDHLTPINELFSNQINSADIILVSHADTLSKDDFNRVKKHILSSLKIPPLILPINHGNISPSFLLGHNKHDSLRRNLPVHNHEHHLDDDLFSETLRLEIMINKNSLENLLIETAHKYKTLRIKGRCWLPGKALPLQVQLVGTRLNSWYEKAPGNAWKPKVSGLDLVLISLIDGASKDISSALKEIPV